MKSRGFFQNLEVGLQGRGVEAANRRCLGQTHLHLQHPFLDHLKPSLKGNAQDLIYLHHRNSEIRRLFGQSVRPAPPPGNKVIWRGMEKLAHIQIGFELGKLVGN